MKAANEGVPVIMRLVAEYMQTLETPPLGRVTTSWMYSVGYIGLTSPGSLDMGSWTKTWGFWVAFCFRLFPLQ